MNGAVAPHVKATSMKPLSSCVSRVLAALAGSLLAAARRSTASKTSASAPPLSAVDNPTARPGYKPVQMPMPAAQPASYNPNSLWRNGSRAFFKDQRAHQIGDILTVQVNITDKADHRQRDAAQPRRPRKIPASTNFFGKSKVPIMNSAAADAASSPRTPTTSIDGKGSVNRSEALQTNVAAVVTQVLPNGNLVVEGKQEIRVNFEIRELIVAGIVRPGGHPERQHHRLRARSRRRASLTAAAARSPTCSSRATASRCST